MRLDVVVADHIRQVSYVDSLLCVENGAALASWASGILGPKGEPPVVSLSSGDKESLAVASDVLTASDKDLRTWAAARGREFTCC